MPRILLIDDDETCLDTIGRLLRLHGYDFSGALTGSDGLRVAREWKPDVALVDLRLPDTSGIDVLAQLTVDCPQTSRVLLVAPLDEFNKSLPPDPRATSAEAQAIADRVVETPDGPVRRAMIGLGVTTITDRTMYSLRPSFISGATDAADT